jgi:serine/threonine protein kinase
MANSPTKKPTALDKGAFGFLAPAERSDEIGRLGHYRVLKLLGKGGMGMVFMAEDTSLQRIVALKVMLPDIARRDASRERFIREARAVARIEHDHIIPIFSVDTHRGVPFIAMPLLRGLSLEEWLKQGRPLTLPQVLRIGREIAKGLHAAHERGLIHRDIKPANLWLDATSKGRVKILDFGLARGEKDSSAITLSGQVVGTPSYMSPEQAAGEALDARSDLFALGVVLYRLCTGVLPFRGPNVMAVLSALANADPDPVDSVNPEVPAAFSDLIGRLLRKRPADRPANGKQVADTIAAIERARALQKLGSVAPSSGPTTPIPSSASIPLLETSRVAANQIFNFDDDPSDSYLSESDMSSAERAKEKRHPEVATRSWLPIALIGGLAALVLIVIGIVGVVLALRPGAAPAVVEEPVGIVELAADGIQDRVQILHDDTAVATLQPGKRQASLKVGRYSARVVMGGGDYRVDPPEFELKRDMRLALRIRSFKLPTPDDLPKPPPKAPVKPKVDPPPVKLVTQPGTIDLLSLVDLSQDQDGGNWTKWGTGGFASDATKAGPLWFPYKPPAEYDLHLIVTRVAGKDSLSVRLVDAGKPFRFILAGNNAKSGFGLIAGKDFDANATTVVGGIDNDKQQTLLIKVRRDSVHALLNGNAFTGLQTDPATFDLPAKDAKAPQLGVQSLQSQYVVHSASVEEITGAGEFLRPADPAAKTAAAARPPR